MSTLPHVWLISVVVVTPVIFFALGQELPPRIAEWLHQILPDDRAPTTRNLSLSVIAGVLVAGTPLRILVRYFSTVVHELGHASAAAILGGRPRNIIIAPSASGLATYNPPITWGRFRATLVSLAGYPAPALASLAAIRALQIGQTRSWFTFAAGTLAVAIVLLIRNFWGFLWTGAVVGGSYYAARFVDVEYLGIAVAAIAGFLAIEGTRNAWEQLHIVRYFRGSGCDAERVAMWWKINAVGVGVVHFLLVAGLSGFAMFVAIRPDWHDLYTSVEAWITK